MSNAEHAASGLIIGSLLRTATTYLTGWIFWLFYAIISFLSHLGLDAIPHHHFFRLGQHAYRNNKKGFWLEIGPGAVFALIVFPALGKRGPDAFFYYFWGMFWANILDILALISNLFRRFNGRCHLAERGGKKVRGRWQYLPRWGIMVIFLYRFLF